MDVNRAIRMAVNTGETVFGVKEAFKSLEDGEAEMMIVSDNCPEENFQGDEFEGVPIYHFDGNNHELGSAAGKPFAVSTLTVLDPGQSKVLSLKAD